MIIGLDVGGTHTDVVLLGREGLIREVKVRTDAEDLFKTVLSGLEKITSDIPAERIQRAVLSTTLTTNAVVQGKIPAVGMIVSAGPGIDPEHFRTNDHYYTVSGAIDHRGREITPLDSTEISAVADTLQKAGIRNVGIAGKFSTRNPDHELAIARQIQPAFGKLFLGHRISGNLNFPRRIATTYLNAWVRPIHKSFFEAVQRSLKEKGLTIPIHILKADGGTMSFDAALDFPAQTILSGPSASVMGATAYAGTDAESLVLDIGGTTTDMAVLIEGAPLLAQQGIVLGDRNTLIRSLETRSIGIGGDSTVRLSNGDLRIGPDRSGPAAAFGGTAPTPTDALCVLDLMTDGDKAAAERSLTPLAQEMGLPLTETADRILEGTCRRILDAAEEMIRAINSKPVYTIHELQEGHKVRPTHIFVLGGPAPHFEARLAKLSGLSVHTVAHWKVANAIGAALARTTCEVDLFADTQQGIATAPEEGYRDKVDQYFTMEQAVEKAFALLKTKALAIGGQDADLEMEVVEAQQFNMVRGFYTTGRNIRVKVQVKPGLIHGYQSIIS